uniref:Uncharacterized protein n=1 Tax=Timema cristinae TaxID=61476 RepID=A0A7R9GPM3_TIMCR|nr:unnamed protein product [Timema cristinae]
MDKNVALFIQFQSVMDQLFQSFSNISMSNFSELSGNVFSWIEENCKPQRTTAIAGLSRQQSSESSDVEVFIVAGLSRQQSSESSDVEVFIVAGLSCQQSSESSDVEKLHELVVNILRQLDTQEVVLLVSHLPDESIRLKPSLGGWVVTPISSLSSVSSVKQHLVEYSQLEESTSESVDYLTGDV